MRKGSDAPFVDSRGEALVVGALYESKENRLTVYSFTGECASSGSWPKFETLGEDYYMCRKSVSRMRRIATRGDAKRLMVRGIDSWFNSLK